MRQEYVDTPVGRAAIAWYEAATPTRAIVVLGHGSATGIDAPDLQAIAAGLPPLGITVALITQPYRLARAPRVRGRQLSDERSLDTAWRAVWPHVATPGIPGNRRRPQRWLASCLPHRQDARCARGSRPVLSTARSGESARTAVDRPTFAGRAGRPRPVRHAGSISADATHRRLGRSALRQSHFRRSNANWLHHERSSWAGHRGRHHMAPCSALTIVAPRDSRDTLIIQSGPS